MLRQTMVLALLGALCTAALAADSVPRRLSLDESIAIALRKNRTLMAAVLDHAAAQADAGVARGAMLPRLDAGENLSYTDNPVQAFSDLLLQQEFAQADFAPSRLNHPGFLANFQSQVRLSFPLFAGGRLLAAYRGAGFVADAMRWQAIEARQRVEFAVVEAYYAAVLAEQRIAMVDRALAAARAHLRQAEDLFGHGMAVNSDVLRTRVMVGSLEEQRIEAESEMHVGWAALAHALGDEDERIAPLRNPVELQAVAQAASPLDALVKQALARRPEIKVVDARVKEADEAVTVARSDYLPTIEVAGVYENDSERLLRAGNNGALLVTGRLNLFHGMATRSKVDAAEDRLARARVLGQELRHAVALEVESAWRRLAAATKALEVARRNTAYADSALKILEDRYASGLATNVAVLDAQTTREEADLRLVSARVAVAVDRAALNLAVGAEPQRATER
ncbi:MAG TPA: TolC family protein [Candidatus Binataceae bacterium]|nr:TolC family protein [Candidatus Binataceae bacterium]